jgi:hypothetical protein
VPATETILVELKAVPTRAVLQLYARILEELRARGVTTTRDSPVGGYGQWLICRALDACPKGNSAKGVDAITRDGERLQIKTRWLAEPNDSRQLSAIRNLSDGLFDFVAAVLLDESFGVHAAYLIPHDTVVKCAKPVSHTNSSRLVLTPRVCSDPSVRVITDRVRAIVPE